MIETGTMGIGRAVHGKNIATKTKMTEKNEVDTKLVMINFFR